MKKQIINLALMLMSITLFFGCNEAEIVSPSSLKITLEELENNSDWQEITNIDSVNICYFGEFEQLLVRESDYKKWFIKKQSSRDDNEKRESKCYNFFEEYNAPIDFNERDLILQYDVHIDWGKSNWETRLFLNTNKNHFVFYQIVKVDVRHFGGRGHSYESLSIPKLPNNIKITKNIDFYIVDALGEHKQ